MNLLLFFVVYLIQSYISIIYLLSINCDVNQNINNRLNIFIMVWLIVNVPVYIVLFIVLDICVCLLSLSCNIN